MLAVLLYSKIENNPQNIPGVWPAEVKEITDASEAPSSDWLVMSRQEYNDYLVANKSAYDAWSAAQATAQQTAVVTGIVKNKVSGATAFGQSIAISFATTNILMGITQAGKTQQVADYCQKLQYYISTGSLYAVLNELTRMLNDPVRPSLGLEPFINDSLLSNYINQVKAYLGIPL